MKTDKFLNINGAVIETKDLEKHLEKIASNHTIKTKSDKRTYPIPRMLENYQAIKEVYNLLNEHLKLGIAIHPAGEWLLDNFYILEETVKNIQKELELKKYINFPGIQNGEYEGFARIYVLASEIIAYTDNKIDRKSLQNYLKAYQINKTLSMDEIWNIGTFLQIVLIEKIRQICEVIYVSQVQKYKAENIVERLVENKKKGFVTFKKSFKIKNIAGAKAYPFVEYMSYTLKQHGKQASVYLKALEETAQKTGTTVSNIIKKEHFNIALQKVSIGNSITSIKKIQGINFLEIFESINGVEEILKSDPANVYERMDHKTKELYRSKIKEISKRAHVSEMYTAKKVLELAQEQKIDTKQSHIGYYLIDKGAKKLCEKLQFKSNTMNKSSKVKLYITCISLLTLGISIGLAYCINKYIQNVAFFAITILLLLIPVSELVIQIIQYILGKVVKPQIIPKLNFYNGIDEKNSTMVVIPTIVKSKEKVQELMKSLEVFYLANKSKNIYFTLLGDCSESKSESESFDSEVIEAGLKEAEILNHKYPTENFPIFHFLYRKRTWNEKEKCYIGWERKRGLLTQFNEYILQNEENNFRTNTIENYKKTIEQNYTKSNKNSLPKIKYIITLDADTQLPLNSAFELVGAMAHILNRPVLNKQENVVIDGHALIQPRVGVSLDISYKNLFTEIFAGAGGIDCYTNAISDIYQDNFDEGIFTGKGIYDLEVFSKVLKNEIPENTVLSHDLLEGSYLRCGLATDILLIDGYPSKYTSFMNRLSRWTRGDWQIIKWSIKGPLNLLSKYKIFDNLRRSLFEVSIMLLIAFFVLFQWIYKINPQIQYLPELSNTYNIAIQVWLLVLSFIVCLPFIIEILDQIIFKKEGEKKQKTFTPKIDGMKGAIIRAALTIGCLPYKAFICDLAKWKTIYRMTISHKHLLEWTTSEEAEKLSKSDLFSYFKEMFVNIVAGGILLGLGVYFINIAYIIFGAIWVFTPAIMWYISKDKVRKTPENQLNKQQKEYLKDIAQKTWEYFKDYLNENDNFLIPDNYQEDRNPLVIDRTSSTNIGLSILAVISSLDLKFIQKEEAIDLLENMINTIDELPKWCGHLYNWYNIKTKEPLTPRYISTVDSGNLVGYLYVLKSFLLEKIEIEKDSVQKSRLQNMFIRVDSMIKATDFSMLYSNERRLFSIGFNIEDNKLTDSYYDLLASEARQASLIAIALGNVPAKHWNNLSRTMTTLNDHKGLVSWSGTAFEYLMPNINIPKYKGSLIDESCKFAIESQIEYSKRLGIPWGITEAAFNAKDLHSNYQYKAFGIPWLGLKRGLADEMVVASYGSILAICEKPKEVVKNLKVLENQGMYNKYGFYESIDYTPSRATDGKIGSPVKTYMAHHQGLILLSINNLFHDNIIQKRFIQNPEIKAVDLLLQERMPSKFILTKESKEKVEKLVYKDYQNYSKVSYNKVDERLIRGNVISNANYTVAINQKGEGVSKFKNYYVNRYKKTDDYPQGIFFYIKNVQNGKIWSTYYNEYNYKPDKYVTSFMPDQNEFERIDGNIKTKMKITISPNEPVEIRRLEIENLGNTEEMLEVSSMFEPILSSKEKDYAHPAFNNLFLGLEYDEETSSIIIKRNKRAKTEEELYLSTTLSTEGEKIGDMEYEIDKEKLIGRGNYGIPKMIKESIPFSKRIGLVTEPVVGMKQVVKVKPGEKTYVDLIISVENNKEIAKENLSKYIGEENVKRTFEISRAKVEAESRYLGIKGKEIETYQKILSYIIFDNPIKKLRIRELPTQKYRQSDLWKYGISGNLPIILITIKDANDIYVVESILKAYEFFRSKNIKVEIVILDEEKHSYENYVREEIESAIMNKQIAYLKNVNGGIYVLSKEEMDKKDINLLKFVSTIIIDGNAGNIENCIKDQEDEYLERCVQIWDDKTPTLIYEDDTQELDILSNSSKFKYYNEYGAFSEDGKEYLIRINKENKLPTVWSHVLANKNFGTIVTDSMGGYTWYKNSRLNRVTAWHNYANLDVPSEVIYIKNMENSKMWSVRCKPYAR